MISRACSSLIPYLLFSLGLFLYLFFFLIFLIVGLLAFFLESGTRQAVKSEYNRSRLNSNVFQPRLFTKIWEAGARKLLD